MTITVNQANHGAVQSSANVHNQQGLISEDQDRGELVKTLNLTDGSKIEIYQEGNQNKFNARLTTKDGTKIDYTNGRKHGESYRFEDARAEPGVRVFEDNRGYTLQVQNTRAYDDGTQRLVATSFFDVNGDGYRDRHPNLRANTLQTNGIIDPPTTQPTNPLTYAGFTVDSTRPDTDIVTVNGKQYSLGYIREQVQYLNQNQPYDGLITTDDQTTDWGRGSSTGLNLISNRLAEVAPNGEPGLNDGANLSYGGFTVDNTRPDTDIVTVNGKQYTLGYIREQVQYLNQNQPYDGPTTRDLARTEWGQGSGTGLRLISDHLATVAPNGEPGLNNGSNLSYGGFTVDNTRPDTDIVTVNGKQYTLGYIREQVQHLNQNQPYNGPVTFDLRTTDWGQGSGTGLRLISDHLATVAPEGEPGLENSSRDLGTIKIGGTIVDNAKLDFTYGEDGSIKEARLTGDNVDVTFSGVSYGWHGELYLSGASGAVAGTNIDSGFLQVDLLRNPPSVFGQLRDGDQALNVTRYNGSTTPTLDPTKLLDHQGLQVVSRALQGAVKGVFDGAAFDSTTTGTIEGVGQYTLRKKPAGQGGVIEIRLNDGGSITLNLDASGQITRGSTDNVDVNNLIPDLDVYNTVLNFLRTNSYNAENTQKIIDLVEGYDLEEGYKQSILLALREYLTQVEEGWAINTDPPVIN